MSFQKRAVFKNRPRDVRHPGPIRLLTATVLCPNSSSRLFTSQLLDVPNSARDYEKLRHSDAQGEGPPTVPGYENIDAPPPPMIDGFGGLDRVRRNSKIQP